MNQFLTAKGIENANVVNIQGTIGATAQIGRTRGLERACTSHGNMTLLAEVSADFTQAEVREVMDSACFGSMRILMLCIVRMIMRLLV